jgi:hypothetical protein
LKKEKKILPVSCKLSKMTNESIFFPWKRSGENAIAKGNAGSFFDGLREVQ